MIRNFLDNFYLCVGDLLGSYGDLMFSDGKRLYKVLGVGDWEIVKYIIIWYMVYIERLVLVY